MDTIDKLAWVHIENRSLLVGRSHGKEKFYTIGGKREKGESDTEALIREVREEVGVDLIPTTIGFLNSFRAQAHGKAEGVDVVLTCYKGDYRGTLSPQSEIEELGWFTTRDRERATIPMRMILDWLHEEGLVA